MRRPENRGSGVSSSSGCLNAAVLPHIDGIGLAHLGYRCRAKSRMAPPCRTATSRLDWPAASSRSGSKPFLATRRANRLASCPSRLCPRSLRRPRTSALRATTCSARSPAALVAAAPAPAERLVGAVRLVGVVRQIVEERRGAGARAWVGAAARVGAVAGVDVQPGGEQRAYRRLNSSGKSGALGVGRGGRRLPGQGRFVRRLPAIW